MDWSCRCESGPGCRTSLRSRRWRDRITTEYAQPQRCGIKIAADAGNAHQVRFRMKTFAWRGWTGGVVPACTRLLLHGGRVSAWPLRIQKAGRRDGQFFTWFAFRASRSRLGGGSLLPALIRIG